MPKELNDAFGRVLKKYRKSKGWSQMKLAMEAEMHLNTLGSVERGEYSPTLQTIFAVCRALGVPAGEFIAEVEKTHSEE